MTTEERFWAKVKKSEGCWLWTASKDGQGYPQFDVLGKNSRAHRYCWELHNGPIPEGMCVLHRCDNPPCVRPDHLFLGTKRDNTQDMLAKGRQGCARMPGSRNPRAKLTEVDIPSIRDRRSRGDLLLDIARDYGVSEQLIWLIVHRRAWKHV